MRQSADDYFISNEFDYGVAFKDIASFGPFWTFMNATLLPNLFPVDSYSGKGLSRLVTWTACLTLPGS